MRYFLAMRPAMGCFAVALCLAGFQLQNRNLAKLPLGHLVLLAVVIFVACSLSMLWNDFYDRKRDLLKGKTFVAENQDKFWLLSYRMSLLLGVLIGFIQSISYAWFSLTMFLTVVSIYYVRSYRYLILPTVLVSFCAASPLLYSLTWRPTNILACTALFVAVFSVITAREILKDIEDLDGDRGYKCTLPITFGVQLSRRIAAIICFAASFLSFVLLFSSSLKLIALLLFACGLVICQTNKPLVVCKITIDGCCVLLLVLVLSGRLIP
jgi:geranylgeranylglycerol-phosphate geranylgeranyltransferase